MQRKSQDSLEEETKKRIIYLIKYIKLKPNKLFKNSRNIFKRNHMDEHLNTLSEPITIQDKVITRYFLHIGTIRLCIVNSD